MKILLYLEPWYWILPVDAEDRILRMSQFIRIYINGDYLSNSCIPSPSQSGHLFIRQLELVKESLSNLSSHLQAVTEGKETHVVICFLCHFCSLIAIKDYLFLVMFWHLESVQLSRTLSCHYDCFYFFSRSLRIFISGSIQTFPSVFHHWVLSVLLPSRLCFSVCEK